MQPKFRAVIFRGKYYAVWTENGEVRRKSLRTADRGSAEAELKRFVSDFEIANRPPEITVQFVWDSYREALGAKPTAATMGFEWKAVGPFFGTKAAEILTEQDSLDYAAQRAKAGRRPSTIRTELAHLRSALLWAQKKKIIGVAPAIILPEASAPRDSRLTKSQAVKFIGACEMPHVRLFVILALTTGARMGAILGLKWDRVDFDQSLIYFEDPDRPKTNKRRGNPPMNKTARAALSAARAGATSPYVIEWAGQPVASVKKGLASAGERCGLPWVTAHVFRHSAATFMAEDRVSMAEIAQFLAHADSRLTERVYARFSPDHLREAADALEIDLMREAVPGMECSTVQLHRTTEQKRPKRDRKGE